MKKISIIGSGSWGSALATVLNDNNYDVVLWSFKKEEAESIIKYRENKEFLPNIKIDEKILVTNNKEDVKNSDIVIFATPSKFVRSVVSSFVPYLSGEEIIVNVSKGLEDETLLRLSEVIKQELKNEKICVLSGPSHAEEVGKRLPTVCVCASEKIEVAEVVQNVFMNSVFRVYTSNDIIGVEVGGALKNLIALAAGISDGVGYGDNTKAALMTRGIAEIARLGVAMGGKVETFAGLSGVGDLIVTCTSMHSRNRRAGILLGKGKTLDETLKEVHMVVEGVNTAKAAYNLSKKYNINMPITTEIYDVVFNGKTPKQAVCDLMTRDKTQEN